MCSDVSEELEKTQADTKVGAVPSVTSCLRRSQGRLMLAGVQSGHFQCSQGRPLPTFD